MPLPRLRRAAAVALTTVVALGGVLGAALPAAAVDDQTDVKDASCVAGDTRALCAPLGQLLDVRIGDVHPTQPSLGYDEVFYKLGRYDAEISKDKINKKFDDWCEANGQKEAAAAPAGATLTNPASFTCAVPVGGETSDTIAPMKTVVIGPGGVLYLTDGHHTLTSFQEDSGPDVHVRLRVLGNLSGLSEQEFWTAMQANKWTWLRDVDGNAITPAQLPANVGLANFQDDRYRSVMYFGRDIGYAADGAVPFQEFYWGSWLRGADLGVAEWNQDDWAASLALVKKITTAQTTLPRDTVVDPASGYTAGNLSALLQWNDGKAESKGEWSKLSQPYSAAKPGKLAYMTEYRLRHPRVAPSAPAAPQVSVVGTAVTATWTAPAPGSHPITGYTVSFGGGVSLDVASDLLTATFVGVTPGTRSVTVVAKSAAGSSAPSPGTEYTVVDPKTVRGTVAISGDLRPGGKVTVSATGLAASAAGFAIEVHSTPVTIGSADTAADGSFTAVATLPADIAPGAHTLVVTLDGAQVASAPFTVASAGGTGGTGSNGSGTAGGSGSSGTGTGTGALATTGSDAPIGLGLAGLAIIAAGVILVAVRRRQRA